MRKIVWAGAALICGLLVVLITLDFIVFTQVTDLGPELVYQPTQTTGTPQPSPSPADYHHPLARYQTGNQPQAGGIQI